MAHDSAEDLDLLQGTLDVRILETLPPRAGSARVVPGGSGTEGGGADESARVGRVCNTNTRTPPGLPLGPGDVDARCRRVAQARAGEPGRTGSESGPSGRTLRPDGLTE